MVKGKVEPVNHLNLDKLFVVLKELEKTKAR